MTNILALPLVELVVRTGSNEDWVDVVDFLQADGVSQLDISGIAFYMQCRPDVSTTAEVDISASTQALPSDDGQLIHSLTPGQEGYLEIKVPVGHMKNVTAQNYLGDIIAVADGFQRRCVTIALTVEQGITRGVP